MRTIPNDLTDLRQYCNLDFSLENLLALLKIIDLSFPIPVIGKAGIVTPARAAIYDPMQDISKLRLQRTFV